MGQQQLLLVILVTIIVGIATVVAINVFGSSAKNANIDAVRQDMLTIATSAQGWYIKPTMMGGGGNSFKGLTFRDLSFPYADTTTGALIARNMNGRYKLNASDSSVIVQAYPADDSTQYLECTVKQNNVVWQYNSPH